MKKQTKKLLAVLFGVVMLFFTSCQKEELETTQSESDQYKVKEYTFKEAIKNSNFDNAFHYVSSKMNKSKLMAKPIYDNQFVIDSSTIKEIVIGNITTYTMYIKREHDNDDYFENLVIKTSPNDSTRAYIITYKPDRELTYNIEHHSYSFHGTSTTKEIHYDSSIFQPLVDDGECSIKLLCDYGGSTHAAGGNCTQTYILIDCPVGGGGAPGGPTGGTGTGTGSGGSGSGGSGSGGVGSSNGTGGSGSGTGGTGTGGSPINGDPVDVVTATTLPITYLNLTWALSLDATQTNWVNSPAQAATKLAIQKYLNVNKTTRAKEFAKELINLAIVEPNQADVNSLVNISLIIESGDYYNNALDDNFLEKIDPYVDLDLKNPPSTLSPNFFALRMYLNYVKLRKINPDWSKSKCAWHATKDVIHLGLDAFGLIPVGGEIADLINGAIYTVEGDGLNATLSYASAIPVLGWASVSTKYAIKVTTTLTGKTKLVWKGVGNTVEFGNRAQLRKVLGLAVGDLRQAHHIIPWAKSTNEVIQKAAKSGNAFHMNEALNGIALSTAVHSGSHNLYDQRVLDRLIEIERRYGPNMTPQQAYNGLNSLINDIRIAIQNNPDTHINQLIF